MRWCFHTAYAFWKLKILEEAFDYQDLGGNGKPPSQVKFANLR